MQPHMLKSTSKHLSLSSIYLSVLRKLIWHRAITAKNQWGLTAHVWRVEETNFRATERQQPSISFTSSCRNFNARIWINSSIFTYPILYTRCRFNKTLRGMYLSSPSTKCRKSPHGLAAKNAGLRHRNKRVFELQSLYYVPV